MEKIRLIVADDHPVFREGLCRFINEEPDMQVIASIGDGAEAVRLVQEMHPDVAVMDIAMPGLNGIEAARQISSADGNTAILMLSAFGYESYLWAALRAGAKGYILKSAPVSEIISAIRLIRAGQAVFDDKSTSALIGRLGNGQTRQHSSILQDNELEVLKLAARGLSNRNIADSLALKERTIQTHMANIFRKLKVSSRTEAVLRALRLGQIDIGDMRE